MKPLPLHKIATLEFLLSVKDYPCSPKLVRVGNFFDPEATFWTIEIRMGKNYSIVRHEGVVTFSTPPMNHTLREVLEAQLRKGLSQKQNSFPLTTRTANVDLDNSIKEIQGTFSTSPFNRFKGKNGVIYYPIVKMDFILPGEYDPRLEGMVAFPDEMVDGVFIIGDKEIALSSLTQDVVMEKMGVSSNCSSGGLIYVYMRHQGTGQEDSFRCEKRPFSHPSREHVIEDNFQDRCAAFCWENYQWMYAIYQDMMAIGDRPQLIWDFDKAVEASPLPDKPPTPKSTTQEETAVPVTESEMELIKITLNNQSLLIKKLMDEVEELKGRLPPPQS